MNYTIHRDGYTRQKYICYWIITDYYTCFTLRNKTLQAILSISCAPCDSVLSPSHGYQPVPDFRWNKSVFWVLNLLSKWNHIIILPLASFTFCVFEVHPYCDQYFIPVLIRVLQRNRANWMCTHTQIYFKEVTYIIMEAGKFRICRMSQQAGNPGRASPKPVCWKSSSLASGEVCLFSIQAFNWLVEVHPHYGREMLILCWNNLTENSW